MITIDLDSSIPLADQIVCALRRVIAEARVAPGTELPTVRQLAADLGERALSKVLAEEGRWQSSQSSVLVVEGLLQYLTDDEVRGLLSEAAACTSPGSRIVFTHAIPGERKILSTLVRLIGEPWKSAVRSEDLPEYVSGTGWAMTSDVDIDHAHGLERYGVAERR